MSALRIPIGLDKSAAEATAQQFREDMRKLNQGLFQDARAASALELQEAQRQAEVRKQIKSQQTEGEIRLARKLYLEQMGLNDDLDRRLKASGAVAEEAGEKGKKGFDAMGLAVAATAAGVTAAAKVMTGLVAEFDRVGEKSRELSERFKSDRDKLRELAAVEGKAPDTEFTLGMHRFAKENAMSFDEATSFRSNFANVGNQFKGKNISEAEYEQYQALSAQNASRTAASPEAAALFSGAFLTKDLSKHGNKAAEEAFRQQFQVGSVYDAGEGSATQNFTAFAALKKEFESDPELKTAFKSDLELAMVGSIANAAGPDRQREQVSSLVRALRDNSNADLNALKSRAGVKSDASIQEIIEKIAPQIQAEAKTKGIGLDQAVANVVTERQAQEALRIQISQGIEGGGYAQRRGVAEKAGAAGAGETALTAFMGTDVAKQRMAEADVASAGAERAAKNSELTTIRQQALARLIRSERIDTNATGVNDFMNKGASFGLIGSAEQKRIDDEVQSLLQARSGGTLDTLSLAVTPEAREAELRGQIEKMRKGGLNPSLPSDADALAEASSKPFSPISDLFSSTAGWLSDKLTEPMFPKAPVKAVPSNPTADVGPDGRPRGGDPALKVLESIDKKLAPAGPNRAPAPKPLIPASPAMKR